MGAGVDAEGEPADDDQPRGLDLLGVEGDALGAGEDDQDLVVAFRDAPEDDEPWTAEDEAAVAEADADFAAGRTVSHEAIKREFGIE